ncbi:MAG: Crp/Fnr family transcriptional regulator [Dehalococcoidia bacterium]
MRLLSRLGRRPPRPETDPSGRSTKVGYLTSNELFRGLDDHDLAELDRMTTMTTCKSGRVFYTPGESGEVLFILKKGAVQLYRIAPDGKRLVIGSLGEGAVFGEMGLIGQGMYDSFAEAAQDCTLCVMSRSDVETLITTRPAFAIALLEMVGRRVQDLEGALEQFAFRSVAARLASLLLSLRDEQGEIRGLTHQDLAERAGTHRETATRSLNELRAAGILEMGRERIRVVNPARLQAIADGSAG